MKCLIVDDNIDILHLMGKILGRYGEVTTSDTGEEALSLFEKAMHSEEPFDLVCLDIWMPIMDGHAILAKIRELEDIENTPRQNLTKVIMITGLADDDNMARSFKNHCDGYIVKPIDPERLVQQLTALKLINP